MKGMVKAIVAGVIITAIGIGLLLTGRSEERRVGKECL